MINHVNSSSDSYLVIGQMAREKVRVKPGGGLIHETDGDARRLA